MKKYFSYFFLVLLAMLDRVLLFYDPNMDSVLYAIDWPLNSATQKDITLDLKENTLSSEVQSGLPLDKSKKLQNIPIGSDDDVIVMTKNKEKYHCIIPSNHLEHQKKYENENSGVSELQLIKPLLTKKSCSYRIESYWTYELCHGKYLKQYHEEKQAGQPISIQQYYLGSYKSDVSDTLEFTDTDSTNLKQQKKEDLNTKPLKNKISKRLVDGVELAYFQMNFEEGTICDLTGKPRRASIQYVCYKNGQGEIYEIKETSSCDYDVVVLTSLLCSHPNYQQTKEVVNKIECLPFDGSPRKPESLTALETEGTLHNFWSKNDDEIIDEETPNVVGGVNQKDSSPPVQYETTRESKISANTDKNLLREFLKGEYCLQGGSGWWKHELCFGKHASQFHDELDGTKTVIILGKWDKIHHQTVLENFPKKRPKPIAERKYLSHFYSNGDYCELSKNPRKVEVRLKCLKSQDIHAVSIYLTEPKTCEYILVVESAILCELIDNADEEALVDHYTP